MRMPDILYSLLQRLDCSQLTELQVINFIFRLLLLMFKAVFTEHAVQ